MKLVPHIKIWLSTADDQNIIGSGRCRLLKAIDEHGSLSAAAQHLDISYRKAWGDLKKAERHIGKKLLIKSRGGSGGGKTVLTQEGIKLLKAYTELVDDVEKYAVESYAKLMEGFVDENF